MTTAVTVSATYADRHTLDELQKMIAARVKYLRGQTTQQAVTATVINVLGSLRANMAVAKRANPIGPHWRITIEPTSYVGGWAYSKKFHKGRRVLRPEGGGHHLPFQPVNKAGDYARGKNGVVYNLKIDCRGKSKYEAIVVGSNYADIEKHAENIVRDHIAQYAGVNRSAVALLQHRVAQGGSVPSLANPAANKQALTANAVADRAALVTTSGSGYASGSYGVTCKSDITASAYALKGGPAYVNTAMQKAANKTAVIIRRFGQFHFNEQPPAIPFPKKVS